MRRYALIHDPDPTYRSQMLVRPDGKWVKADEAADRIAALESQLAEAKEALEPFAAIAQHHAADAPEWDDGDTIPAIVRIGDLRAALAKLEGKA